MRVAILLTLSLALSGCSGLSRVNNLQSDYLQNIPVTVAEVQMAIACDFHYAFQDTSGRGRDKLGNWGAIVELSLGAKDQLTLVPGIGALTAKVGNGKLTAGPTSATFDDSVEDKNVMAYGVELNRSRGLTDCAPENGPGASSGLGLKDFVVGAAQVMNSGGVITSTSALTAGGFAVDGTLIGPGTLFPGLATTREAIPTIRYVRSFSVNRKVGGGLNFQMGDIALSLTGSSAQRNREFASNKITVTMGALPPTRSADEPVKALEDSIWNQRSSELQTLQDFTPNSVVVVNQPPTL